MAKDKQELALATAQLPDFLKGEKGGAGTEALSGNALSPPRLKLAQALSPELETYAGLKAGGYFNNLTERVYDGAVSIIPCFLSESYLLFAPRVPGSSGGLLARADDGVHWNPSEGEFEVTINKQGHKAVWKLAPTVGASGLANWGTSNPADKTSQPAATHVINCVCMAADKDGWEGPLVLSFVRSALKVGKKFASNLKLSRVPAYGRVFELASAKVEGPSGPYFEPRVKALGFVSNLDTFAQAKEIYEIAFKQGVVVDVGEMEGAEDRAAAENEANNAKY